MKRLLCTILAAVARHRPAGFLWWVVLGSNQWPLLCESSALQLS